MKETWEKVEWVSEERSRLPDWEGIVEHWQEVATYYFKYFANWMDTGFETVWETMEESEVEDLGRWLYNVCWSVKITVAWSTVSDSNTKNKDTH